jgi:hypothetical protein
MPATALVARDMLHRGAASRASWARRT